MCNFTKGKWKMFNERVGIVDNSDTQSYGMMLEVAYVDMYNFGDAEGKSNAHLISAAPEMYEMLDELTGILSQDATHVREAYIGYIEKLLAKARGEHV